MISIVPKIVYENACAKIHLHMYNSLTKYVFWNRDISIFVFGFVYEKAEGKKNMLYFSATIANWHQWNSVIYRSFKEKPKLTQQNPPQDLLLKINEPKKDLLPLSWQTHNENEI